MSDGPKIALVGGGVRSGKSDFALRHALAHARRAAGSPDDAARRVTLVATAQALDAEMRSRIDAHRRDRPSGVRTIEEPLAIVDALARAEGSSAIVVDCLTLWVTNLLMAELDDATIRLRFDALAAALVHSETFTVLVTNEVGMGIVPADPLTRRFRDLAGALHASLAKVADEVYLGAVGLLLRLKPGPVTPVER
jgi:adenosylcobinamide kinase/adenosylcobinamide-phosphate guanylyltransferase